MLNLVALVLVQDVMHQQFQTEPLRRERDAPRQLRWRLTFVTWTRPIATLLRNAADYLDAAEQPAFRLTDLS
jgi:hypothetical protein